jgi:hypothetical protein
MQRRALARRLEIPESWLADECLRFDEPGPAAFPAAKLEDLLEAKNMLLAAILSRLDAFAPSTDDGQDPRPNGRTA